MAIIDLIRSVGFGNEDQPISLNFIRERIAELEKSVGDDMEFLHALDKIKTASTRIPSPTVINEADIDPAFAWLPFSTDEAIQLMGLTRVVNRRKREGYYRDRLAILVTQEKSASTLHSVAILTMLHRSGGVNTFLPLPRNLKGGPLAMAGQASFHFGLLLYYPNGGVIRGEFRADVQTLWMIHRKLGCKRIILTRHPADRLVALYCMRAEAFKANLRSAGHHDTSEEAILNNLFLGGSLPANIGSLRSNLEWLDGWLEPEARKNALIVRYEDMLVDMMSHFECIHDFLYGRKMDPALASELIDIFNNSGEGGALQSGDSEKRSYPKGYSGKVGVWRNYLTDSNIQTYNTVVENFLEYSTHADELLAIYPDLLLDPVARKEPSAADETGLGQLPFQSPLDQEKENVTPVHARKKGIFSSLSSDKSRFLDMDQLAELLCSLQDTADDEDDIERCLQGLRDLANHDPTSKVVKDEEVYDRLAWLPFSLTEALPFIGLSRIVSRRIQKGYYRDRLIVLITQEKSSSTLHEVAVQNMLRYSGHQKVIMPLPRNLKCGPVTMTGGATFHPGMLYYFPNGGVCRGVFAPTPQNMKLMGELGCRKLVLVRHPADRMVAKYCMSHSEYNTTDLGKALNQVVTESLSVNLAWLDGWLRLANDGCSLIVRYEDMIEDRSKHFSHIHDFLYNNPMGVDLARELDTLFIRSGEDGNLRSGGKSTRFYPKGYSGKIGIWRDYLTKENVEIYNELVKHYLAYSEYAEDLLKIYPDLLLNDLDPGG